MGEKYAPVGVISELLIKRFDAEMDFKTQIKPLNEFSSIEVLGVVLWVIDSPHELIGIWITT